MPLTMHVEKAKLPKGMSYPMKTSVLHDAFMAAGIEVDTQIILAPSKIFFDAYYWLPNDRLPYDRIYIRIGTIPNAEAHAARNYVEGVVIPELIAWLQNVLALPPESTQYHQEHNFWRDFPQE